MMKRRGGYGVGGGRDDFGRGGDRAPKKPRRDEGRLKWQIRILVTSRVAGGLIGKGGEKIKRLRSSFANTSISLSDSSSPERIYVIGGATFDDVFPCFQEVVSQFQAIESDDYARSRDRRRNRDRDRKENDEDGNPQMELRVLIHTYMAGVIIGRGGFKVKELREQTGASIKIFPECRPNSSERVCILSGSKDSICDCLEKILKLTDETEMKGDIVEYDPMFYDPMTAVETGGYEDPEWRGPREEPFAPPFGRNPPWREYPPPRNFPPPFEREYEDGYGAFRGGRPAPRLGANFPFSSGRGLPSQPQPRYGGYDSYSNGGGGGGGAGRPPPYGAPGPGGYGGGKVERSQVTIPDTLAGIIIGKGGSKINEIRQRAGAEIEVDRGPPGADRIITITGSSESIQRATQMLQDCVRDDPAGRQYIASMEQGYSGGR